jgi:hypothetical protein
MQRGLFVSLYYALLVVSALAVFYGRASDATRQSLLGIWRGDFHLDSTLADVDLSGEGPLPSRLTIRFAADTAPEWWPVPPWQQPFSGHYAPTRDPRIEGAYASHALAVRDFQDAVSVALGPPCCDAGGVIAQGTVRGDTITGRWFIDSDARRAFGDFQLLRVKPSPPRAQNSPNEAERKRTY